MTYTERHTFTSNHKAIHALMYPSEVQTETKAGDFDEYQRQCETIWKPYDRYLEVYVVEARNIKDALGLTDAADIKRRTDEVMPLLSSIEHKCKMKASALCERYRNRKREKAQHE